MDGHGRSRLRQGQVHAPRGSRFHENLSFAESRSGMKRARYWSAGPGARPRLALAF